MSLLQLIRDSHATLGVAIGRGTEDDPDEIVDVQIAATGDVARRLVEMVEPLQREIERGEGESDVHVSRG